jgi:two-component system sensor histidine kinase HydH
VVWLMAARMTDTLKEVSSVAARVAGGDFSRKIAIQRQDELGVLIQTFNTMIDRTKGSYESLQAVNWELSEKVAELTRTRAELSQKQRLAIIGETISKISHEIQNKIGGVSIWLQNLETELTENPTARVYLNEMKTALRSFLDMLTHFKRFYREPKLEKQSAALPSVLDAVLLQLTEEIQGKQLTVKRKDQSGVPRLWADPKQLEEAILNIIINAIYYSPPKGTISIEVAADSEEARLLVSDEGPGIPPEHARNLFQPFFTTKSSGSGLGLAIADSIVRAHGGHISFQNLPEKGVTFIVHLPIKPE